MKASTMIILGLIGAGVVGGIYAAVVRKPTMNIVTIKPLPPDQSGNLQSNIVTLYKVTLTHVNASVSPALYSAILSYSDGSQNKNGALYSSNINDLASLGIPVINNIDNPQDIPAEDQAIIT